MKYWGIIRAKWKIDGTTTLEEAAESLEAFANSLREMDKDGIKLINTIEDDYGFVETDDKEIAKKWEFHEKDYDEDEFDEEEIAF